MRKLPCTQTLKDGTQILIRDVARGDRALVEAGFAHLSDRSRFLRFLTPRKQLTERELDVLTDPTDEDDVAIGAVTVPGRGQTSMPIGLARFIRLTPGGNKAEFALTVVDTFQGKGAGRLLLRALAHRARHCGVQEFLAYLHRDNRAMRGLLESYGATRTTAGRTEIEMTASVAIIADLR